MDIDKAEEKINRLEKRFKKAIDDKNEEKAKAVFQEYKDLTEKVDSAKNMLSNEIKDLNRKQYVKNKYKKYK